MNWPVFPVTWCALQLSPGPGTAPASPCPPCPPSRPWPAAPVNRSKGTHQHNIIMCVCGRGGGADQPVNTVLPPLLPGRCSVAMCRLSQSCLCCYCSSSILNTPWNVMTWFVSGGCKQGKILKNGEQWNTVYTQMNKSINIQTYTQTLRVSYRPRYPCGQKVRDQSRKERRKCTVPSQKHILWSIQTYPHFLHLLPQSFIFIR